MKNIVMKIAPNKEKRTAHKEAKKYKKYGVRSEEYEAIPNYGISNAIDASIDVDATSVVRDYTGCLKNGLIKNDPYYIGKAAFRNAIEAFYTGVPGTRAYECTLIDLTHLGNVVRRKVLNKSLKKDYKTLVGTTELDNIKFAAWVVTHAYVTGLFMTPTDITDVMAVITIEWSPENKFAWNLFVDSISDIRDSVKHLFTFSDGEGSCPYLVQKCIAGEVGEEEPDPAEDEHPSDDQAFDDKADVCRIDLVTADVINGNKEMDAQYKVAVSKEERKDNDVVMNLSNEVVKEEVTVAPPVDNLIHFTPKVEKTSDVTPVATSISEQDPMDDEDYDPQQITFGDVVAEQKKNGNVVNPAVVASVLSNTKRITTETLPKFIEENNKQWDAIPRLSRFTAMVNHMGKMVLYATDEEFLGLIKAQIIDDKGDVHRELRLDPCIVYGDTLRVVTTDHPRGDIRLETFVPISDDKRVKQIIEGPLTKDQRRAIIEPIPNCLYVRQKYHFLDRIDLRGISAPGTEIIGLPFNDWRKLVTNISNIIKDPNFPICRMRVSEYKDPDNFQLVCDDKVLCAWPTEILGLPSNIKALSEGFFVNATSDSAKKGVQGYFYTGPDHDVEQKKEEEKTEQK